MTKAQRNAITSPAQGLLVFNTDDNTLDYYNGANWLTLNGSAKYIKLGMGVTNQSVNIGTDIAFTAVRASSGMTRSGNGVDLKAGVTYRIEASVDTYLADGGAYLGYSLHNGASYFGNVAYTNEGDQTSWGFKSNILEIYKPATDMTVTVRVADDNIGAGTVHGGWNSNLTVTELVPSGPAGGGGNDNLGNHTASQNIGLGSFWLSGDGGNEGVFVTSAGDVGIGLNNPSERFEVSGKVKATQLCIGADCRSAWPSGAGGTVTQVTSANTDIGVATTTTTPVLTLNTGTGADQILKLNGSGAIPAVSGVNLTNLNPSALSSAVPVPKGGTAATSFSPDQMVIANGAGSALQSFFCPPGNILKFGAGGIAACDTIAGALGYTPANGTNYVAKAGDTMTGTLTLASNGLVVGSNQLVVSGGNVGVGAASSAEKLEVSGAIKLGDAAGTQDGTVRWNGTDFEGRAGGVWKSLTGSSTTSPTAFSVHRNGVDQTVAMATWTKLTWTHENFDTDNTFASSRFTPTKAGRYMFTGQIYCSDNVAHCSGAIYKNGVQLSYNFGRTTSAAPIVSMLVDMNGTTDYVELYAYNPDGTTISGSKTLTYFTGFLTSSTTATNSGSGTANYVPAWTSSTTLGNSPLAISSGNVGIGTTAPNALLALSASSGSSVDFSLNRGTTQQAPPSTYPAADEGRFKFYQGDAGFGFRRYLDIISNGQLGTANSAIRFFTNSGGAAVGERVRIDESGNVGIGTTTPDAKLEVAGPVIRTIAHVAGNASDGTDVGQVPGRVLTVTKARAGTSWRIGWTDGRRAMGGGCRWEIRVDGASCPGGALVFDQHSLTAADPHVVGHVVGYCDGISAGSHQVQIWVNSSPGYSGVDCYTGWQGSRWMLEVEEVN
jgi:hypothetical protein